MMTELGNLYVIAAPSGAGKTTLVKALVESMSSITVSISHTTRSKRPNEVDGVNYYFLDKPAFQRLIDHGDFLEYATIFDNFYGTSKSWVEQTLIKGTDVILEIDWQGHQQIKRLFPNAISIFILPPSLAQLRDRLITRDQDSQAVIEERLADTRATVKHVPEFDYLVVNDDFDHALGELKTIISAERLHTKRQLKKYAYLIKELSQK